MIDIEKGFVTYEDVRMKLHNCFVTYKGVIYVCRVEVKQKPGENNHRVLLYPPEWMNPSSSQKVEPIDIDYRHQDVDISAISLGYINTDKSAYLIERHPLRRNGQGVSTANVTMYPSGRADHVMYSAHIQVLVNDKYPSYEEALKSVSEDVREACAFSKIFAFFKNESDLVVLRLRKRDIGYVQNGVLTLYEALDRSFIVKQLMKHGAPV